MLSLRYHRQYLWVFFMMFMVLVCVALAIDCCYAGTGSGTSNFQLKTPRFMNVACVGVFAAISVVIQHALSRAIVKSDVLIGDRRKWYSKNIKVRKGKKVKKLANKRRYTEFMFASMLCNIINLIPVIVLYGLWVGKVTGVDGVMKFSDLTNRTTLAPEFFIPAVFIKYFAWYVNGFCAWCGLFRKNPRRNVLLASPLNI